MTPDEAMEGKQPTREELGQLPGPLVVEFGASWCGHCLSLAPYVTALLNQFAGVQHIKVEDGKGKPLGRSFGVKLWPTFVFMKDGQVIQQLVRPGIEEVRQGLETLIGKHPDRREQALRSCQGSSSSKGTAP